MFLCCIISFVPNTLNVRILISFSSSLYFSLLLIFSSPSFPYFTFLLSFLLSFVQYVLMVFLESRRSQCNFPSTYSYSDLLERTHHHVVDERGHYTPNATDHRGGADASSPYFGWKNFAGIKHNSLEARRDNHLPQHGQD